MEPAKCLSVGGHTSSDPPRHWSTMPVLHRDSKEIAGWSSHEHLIMPRIRSDRTSGSASGPPAADIARQVVGKRRWRGGVLRSFFSL